MSESISWCCLHRSDRANSFVAHSIPLLSEVSYPFGLWQSFNLRLDNYNRNRENLCRKNILLAPINFEKNKSSSRSKNKEFLGKIFISQKNCWEKRVVSLSKWGRLTLKRRREALLWAWRGWAFEQSHSHPRSELVDESGLAW